MAALAQPTAELIFRGFNRRSIIPACNLTTEDLRALYLTLEEKAKEAAEFQVSSLTKAPQQTDAQFASLANEVRDALRLYIRVQTADGDWVAGTDNGILHDARLTEVITQVEFLSGFIFRTQTNVDPQNWFTISIDFTRTALRDLSQLHLDPGNRSNVIISGTNASWAAGVDDSVKRFFQQRRNLRGWLYLPFTYDACVFIGGVPLSLSVVYHIDRLLRPQLSMPESLYVALYVYFVLASLLVFRFGFNYFKWTFPKLEVSNRRPRWLAVHYAFLVLIGTGILMAALRGILKLSGLRLFQ